MHLFVHINTKIVGIFRDICHNSSHKNSGEHQFSAHNKNLFTKVATFIRNGWIYINWTLNDLNYPWSVPLTWSMIFDFYNADEVTLKLGRSLNFTDVLRDFLYNCMFHGLPRMGYFLGNVRMRLITSSFVRFAMISLIFTLGRMPSTKTIDLVWIFFFENANQFTYFSSVDQLNHFVDSAESWVAFACFLFLGEARRMWISLWWWASLLLLAPRMPCARLDCSL